MKRFRLGLVVGKFSPLHKGHELLLRAAQEQAERLVVISYSNPEYPGCEPAKRAQWLERLFPLAERFVLGADSRDADSSNTHHTDDTDPNSARSSNTDDTDPNSARSSNTDVFREWPHNDASAETHRQFVGQLVHGLVGEPVDVVFTSEDYGPGFAQSLTAIQRAFGWSPHLATHVPVDPPRQSVPISATAIRRDVHAHRHFLSPEVYSSFVQRIVILGGESTGKTTLAQRLARTFETSWVPEYGREVWEAQAGQLRYEDLLRIGQGQVVREDASCKNAVRFLFCDTSPLTTRMYSEFMFQRIDPKLQQLAERPYALTVLCAPDVPFEQDGTRQDEAFRLRQHDRYLLELSRRGVTPLVVSGSVDQRVTQVAAALGH